MRPKKRTVEIEFSKVKELKAELNKGHKDKGKILTMLRNVFGLNQRAFADKIGVDAMTVSRWERNVINNPCLTLEQCGNLSALLKKIDLDIYDLDLDFQVLIDLRDLKTYGLIRNTLAF